MWQEGQGQEQWKTDNDVCLKCGQRGMGKELKAIHGLDGQNDAALSESRLESTVVRP